MIKQANALKQLLRIFKTLHLKYFSILPKQLTVVGGRQCGSLSGRKF